LTFNAAGTQATLVLTNLLANGNYHLTSGASTLDFFVLMGDTNQNRTVDVTDLGNLASNYGATAGATWLQGDFNYDGAVDVTDLGDLASNYGAHLASGPSTSASPTASLASSSFANVPLSTTQSPQVHGSSAVPVATAVGNFAAPSSLTRVVRDVIANPPDKKVFADELLDADYLND
jgi:hypothetical protein